MQIAEQAVVAFHYTLTDDDGQVIDRSVEHAPLTYLQGAGQIVPGLERQMDGHSPGDQFIAQVRAEEGYGARHPELMQQVPRSAFPGIDEIHPGMQFQGRSPEGEMSVTVTKVENDTISIDGNHPLAGKTLHFSVEIVDVREATAEEREHGHVHGAGGHAH